MKKTLFYALSSLMVAAMAFAQAEMRTWTNTKGKTVEAEIQKKDSSKVTLKLENGKTATIKLSDLSKEDKEFVESWEPTGEEEKEISAEDQKKVRFKWHRTDKSAFKQAEETGLPVLILFTGPTWNSTSKKLDSEILSKRGFKNGMDGVAVGLICIAEAEKKYKGEWADKLADKYKVTSVPKMILVDPKGNVLGETGHVGGRPPEDYPSLFEEFKSKMTTK